MSYAHNTLVALDTFVNVSVLHGNPDETISSRAQRAATRGDWLGRLTIWWLDKIQPNHGVLAEQGDLARAQTVVDIETKALKK